MKTGKEEATQKALNTMGSYQKIRDTLEIKEIVIGEGEARKRYVLVKNPKQVQRDKEKRTDLLKKLEQELKNLGDLKGKPHTKACCNLVAHPSYGRYIKTLKTGELRTDKAKVKAEEKLDGKYLLSTSDDTLSAEDVALGYKQLIEVEEAFKTLKSTLDLRPVYQRL